MASIDIPVRILLNAVDNASKAVKGVGDKLGGLSGQAKAGAVVLSGLGTAAGLVGKQFIEEAGKFEQYQMAFNTMLGDAEVAGKLFDSIKQEAKKTPFSFEEVVTGSKQLLAMGSAVDEVIPEMRMLGDISAGLGVPMERLILNFGQVRTQGKLTGREMRDFAVAGVPIFEALADQLGVTKDEIADMVSEGDVGFDVVKKAFQAMTTEGGKFFNLMSAQSETTLGKVSNFEDGIQQLQVSLGKALLPAVNQLLDKVIPLIEKFGAWAEKNPKLVTAILGITLGLTVLGGVVGALTLALSGLGAVLAFVTSPIFLIVAAVAALGAAIFFIGKKIYENREAIAAWADDMREKIANWVEGARQKLADFVNGVREFFANAINAGRTKLTEFVTFLQSIPERIAEFMENLKLSIIKFFLEDLPFAIGYAVGRFERFVAEDIPAFIEGVVTWFQELPGRVVTFMENLRDGVVNRFNQMKERTIQAAINAHNGIANWFNQSKEKAITTTQNMITGVLEWIEALPGRIADFLSQIPGIVGEWLSSAKQKAVDIARQIYEGVTEWIRKATEFIQGLIDKAGEAINKVREAFGAGREAGRQFGGSVSASRSYTVGEVGPEVFVPSTAGKVIPAHEVASARGGGGGTQIIFNITANNIVNSPGERRSFAEAILKDLQTLARAQNLDILQLAERMS